MDVKKRVQCDLVVVGGGNAGLVAAIEAKNVGAKVLIIEKAPKRSRGGNSRFSYGDFRVATESKQDILNLLEGATLPKGEFEIEPYPKDDFYHQVMRLSEGWADQRLTEIFVTKSFETVMWMKKQGLKWDINPIHAYKKGDHLFWPASQHFLQASGSGEGLVEMLYGIAENKGIEILYDTAAYQLIMNSENRVCGVLARDIDGLTQVDTKRLILACGGYQANPEKRRALLGENMDLVKLRGTRYNTGDGIQMAYDVGAQLAGHWGGFHASPVSEDSPMVEAESVASQRYSYLYGIMVNREGKRFVDEGENFFAYTYAKFGKEILKQPGGVAFQIFDAKVFPLLRVEYQDAIKVESKTLEELAEEVDIDVEQFIETVKEFNAAVKDEKPFIPYQLDGRRTKGLHPDKMNWAQKIDTPPYRAYAVVCGLTMTYGGLKTNEKAQVIDTSDRPIKGLYAVGEITGGFFYFNYLGATGLTRGSVMGRIAGAEAVSNI
ncbi:MAG: FAD-dependent tricarballylate dehydrogenase TcuA [Thermodesulfobacteriota bacterium]|nr:FAD-dependent tricarballylate dehydrogenase TcuA [Thermodesulfobacteriota bacterium]